MEINIIGTQARDKAIKGMSYVAQVVRSTIGPFGQNVLLQKQNKITNDGYNIAAALAPSIKDEFERRGAMVAQEASSKTNDQVGDATSTAWALTEAIVKEAIRYLPNDKVVKAKKTPAEIIQMINKAKDQVVEELEKMATKITSKEELVKSALVSVEDETIAKLLGETQWELGPEGVIIAEEVNETECSIEKVKGIRWDNGYSTAVMINNPEKQALELSDIPVLMTNYTIDAKELKEILHPNIFTPLVNQRKFGVAIIARAFTSEAVKFCMNSMQTGFPIWPINAPYEHQTEVMKDIETVVGGKYYDIEGSLFTDIHVSDLGFAKRLVVRQFDAVITGEEDMIAKGRALNRIDELKKKIEGEKSDFYKKKLETRIAQLSTGFAILKVGSQSTTNRKRLKDKADDAVGAVRLALKGGTVPGAGVAFKEISEKLEEGNILKRPLTCIYDQIISSAPEGFTIESWVRDPKIVLQTALKNACDVSGSFASINGIVTSANPKECKCDNKQEND